MGKSTINPNKIHYYSTIQLLKLDPGRPPVAPSGLQEGLLKLDDFFHPLETGSLSVYIYVYQ